MSEKIHFNDKFPHSYICHDCAESMGLTWPKHHCATMHGGMCLYCEREATLSAITDWRHPHQKQDAPLVWD